MALINYIPRSAKYLVFTWELNLLLPCFWLAALHSRIYVLKQLAQPAGLQQWYWHGTVRQGSVRFNLIEDESATCLFRSCYIIYLCSPPSAALSVFILWYSTGCAGAYHERWGPEGLAEWRSPWWRLTVSGQVCRADTAASQAGWYPHGQPTRAA